MEEYEEECEGVKTRTDCDVRSQDEYNWQEITTQFVSCCEQLQLGQLLHDSDFGLFEAMSAIEMMDPKMDAGMMCNQTKRKVLSLTQSIACGSVKCKDFTSPELIGIIDETFACLVTWLEGHSLAQTVFTNLYMHDPLCLEDRTLKAFCICLLKFIDLIRDRINRASVFEEEDFQSLTYGFQLAEDVSETRAQGMMREVEEELARTIKVTRVRPGDEADPAREKEHIYATAIHARVKFTRLLYSTLLSLSKEKYQGVEETEKQLKMCTELLSVVKETCTLGVTGHQERDYPSIMGFEPLVNQRLLPPTFPRYTRIGSRVDSVWYLDGLLHRLTTVCSLTTITGLHHVMEFFEEFSKPSPCVLSRSALQLLYLPVNRRVYGTQSMVDVLRDAIRSFLAPPALMPKCSVSTNPQAKDYIDTFLSHAVRPIFGMLQIMGHNRARQRDKWSNLLEDLANLQDEADKVDALLHSLLLKLDSGHQHLACFGTWVLYHTLQTMLHYTLSGFELELYAEHEYHYIYWYLYECLFTWLISTLTRAASFLLEQDSVPEHQKGRTSAKKNKKMKRKTRPHARELTLTQAAQSMCGGYYKAVTGLTLAKKMEQPQFEFDSEKVRYNHRFGPFGCLVTPPSVHYDQFIEMTELSHYDPPITPEDLYDASCKCFHQARLYYEGLTNPNTEVQNLIKVSKTNYVVMKLLLGGHKRDSQEPPEFDFSLHTTFPLIKIL